MKLFLKILRQAIIWGLSLSAAMGIGFLLYAATLLPQLPTIAEIRQVPLNIPLRIYNRDDQLIAEYGNERRIPVSLDDTPTLLINAILATEDDRFYHHTGVDVLGILRAGWNNLRDRSRGQGASTITMQVARNFFLTPEKTYIRKIKEILLAFQMERALTKDEILELYLNKIFLGQRAYGFAAAAQIYYGVELADLSVPEIAMLAGLPKAPSRDNPITNPQRAAERRDHVLKRLYQRNWIDEFSYNAAVQAPVTAARHIADVVDAPAPFVAEMAHRLMLERFGESVYRAGYKVILTIDGEYQSEADAALRKGLLDYDRRHGFRGPLDNLNLDEYDPESLAEALQQYPKSGELLPAVVLENDEQAVTALIRSGETIHIDWARLKWAKAYRTPNTTGPEPTAADEIVQPGDIVHVSQAPANGEWRLDQLPAVSGALVSLDTNTGAILALTGGFDYYLSKFNRATQAQRQPGSNIKPFIYSAALEHGFTAGSLVSAAPIVVEDDLEGVWRPQNYSRKFFGPTRLRKALSLSLNLVSVRLVRAMGVDATIRHLAKFGFDPDRLPRSLSLALGSTTATPLDLAAGFAVFANGGRRITPYLIERIVDKDGNEIALNPDECVDCPVEDDAEDDAVAAAASEETEGESALADNEEEEADQAGEEDGETAQVVNGDGEAAPTAMEEEETTADAAEEDEEDRAISEQNAFLVTNLLQQVIQSGTGRRALALQRNDLAGKTGTTNDYRDAWFSGFNPDIVTTVFVGFDNPSHLGLRESGAVAALPIWVDYMGAVLDDFPEREQTPPAGITTRFINRTSGQPTGEDDSEGYFEYYLEGTEPVVGDRVGGGGSGGSGEGEESDSLF